MVELGELPVTTTGQGATIDAQLDGQPARLIVDTGSPATLLFGGAPKKFGLTSHPLNQLKFYGVGGESAAASVHLKELKVGNLADTNLDMIVTGPQTLGGADGLLGANFLMQADVEFDYPEQKIRFFRPHNCVGDQVVYWGKAYAVEPMAASATKEIKLHVSINGVRIPAEMDTGSGGTVLTTAMAAKLGVRPDSTGVVDAGPTQGMGPERERSFVGVFGSFGFGDETIRNAKLRIADLYHADTQVNIGTRIPAAKFDEPEMLLGADFFKAHRVYVSRDQRKVYVSYMGGPVFDTRAPPAPPAPAAPK